MAHLLRRGTGEMLRAVHFQVERFDVVDSTSERLFARLATGAGRTSDVVVAVEQTAGRGRRGRTWHSARGEGLYLSVLLLPTGPPVPPPAWTMAGGLGVYDLVRSLGLARARLEWPNDLMVAGAKLAGVLAESRAAPDRPHCVLGIGLDVAQRAFPGELLAERAVTSLALEGIEVAPLDLVEPLLDHLAPHLDAALAGGAALAAPFLAALDLGQGPVRAVTPQGPVEGRLLGLDLAAGLTLATEGGARRWPLEHIVDLQRA